MQGCADDEYVDGNYCAFRIHSSIFPLAGVELYSTERSSGQTLARASMALPHSTEAEERVV